MRVLLYADRPAKLGGIETHISDLALALNIRGWDVTVAFRQIDDPRLFKSVVAANIKVVQMETEDVLRRVQEKGFDLIHAHSYGAARTAYRANRQAGIPVVVTVHGPDQRVPFPSTRGLRIVCVSDEIATTLQPYYRDRLAVIENGVDLRRFEASSPAPRKSSTRQSKAAPPMKVAYLGRVGPSKRPGVNALYEATQFRGDVELTFLSNWSPDNSFKPSYEVEKDLRGADLVFSTGRGVREAMALGAAVGVLGVHWDGLVTPHSVDLLRWNNFSGRSRREQPSARAIALVVRELLFHTGRLAELKNFSQQYARCHFDLTVTVQKLLHVYAEVIREAS